MNKTPSEAQSSKHNQATGNKAIDNVQRKRNQAAAHETHMVVWGNNRDKTAQREMIIDHNSLSQEHGLLGLEGLEHHNDPPERERECMDEDYTNEESSVTDVLDAPKEGLSM